MEIDTNTKHYTLTKADLVAILLSTMLFLSDESKYQNSSNMSSLCLGEFLIQHRGVRLDLKEITR